jgi:hypothetical protein
MSPKIFILPFIEPIQSLFLSGSTGTISAIGLPRRAIVIGFFVLSTRERIAEHFVLNSVIVISFMISVLKIGIKPGVFTSARNISPKRTDSYYGRPKA